MALNMRFSLEDGWPESCGDAAFTYQLGIAPTVRAKLPWGHPDVFRTGRAHSACQATLAGHRAFASAVSKHWPRCQGPLCRCVRLTVNPRSTCASINPDGLPKGDPPEGSNGLHSFRWRPFCQVGLLGGMNDSRSFLKFMITNRTNPHSKRMTGPRFGVRDVAP